MSVVALTVPLELSDAGAIIPIPGGGGTGNGTIFVVDTAGFNSISIQFTGTWLANVQFQTSNDRVNWVNTQGFAFNSQITSTDTVVDNDVYLVPVIGRYFQVVVSNYQSGPIGITAYLRYQSIAGLGEASLTQAMDQTTGTPLNVGFQGFTGPGQQNAANSFPVALANEQMQDKVIIGKRWDGTIPVGANLFLDQAQASADMGGFIDASQYRSIYWQINQGNTTVGGVVIFEQSNDGVNWAATYYYDPNNNGLTAGQQSNSSITLSNSSSVNRYFIAPIQFRYVRFRITTAPTGVTNLVVSTRLSMAPYTSQTTNAANILYVGSNSITSGTTMITSANIGTNGYAANAFLNLGGNDRSVVRQEVVGAPNNPVTGYLTNGPWARNAYYDLAGAQGAAGPVPWLAEDKTYPVNVRLERTTNGQDSVQDILQQILVELKAMNYYTRETPLAIANALSTGTPGNPASMLDDPENFFDDPTLYQLKKGH